ncbi:hypothetical protein Glove_340g79 [Diversispora epigaea]|uniref:Uncharacterized protein n=1 Tax=Diversispora epigaea TaxID=1348612 RepID=A0A397HH47_9GLOM|nr:hypothetical protein Glove_340g79 [Diversispora epigaea]
MVMIYGYDIWLYDYLIEYGIHIFDFYGDLHHLCTVIKLTPLLGSQSSLQFYDFKLLAEKHHIAMPRVNRRPRRTDHRHNPIVPSINKLQKLGDLVRRIYQKFIMPITDVTKSSSSETVIFQPLNIPGAFPKPDIRQTYLTKKYFIIWQKNVKKVKENKIKASNIRIYNMKLSVFSTWMRLFKERKLIKSLIRGDGSQFKIVNEILEPIPILKSSRVERRKICFGKKLRFNEQKQVHIFEPVKNDPICDTDENMELDETEDNADKSSIDMKLYNIDDTENCLMDMEKDSLKEIAFLEKQVNQDMMIEVDNKVLNGIKGINRMTAQELAKFYEQKYLKYAKRKKNSVWKDALRMYRFGSFESKERQKKLLCLI